MHLQESGEMYLETIYVLTKKIKEVRSLDVAEYMEFSAPSVCRAVGILKKNGYVDMDGQGYLTLTGDGQRIAEKTYERHVFLTNLFIKLGVPKDIATADACKMEHDISDDTFNAVKKYVKEHNNLKTE